MKRRFGRRGFCIKSKSATFAVVYMADNTTKTTITPLETAFIREHSGEDASKLLFRYSKESAEGFDVAFCVLQIESRNRLRAKLPCFAACEEFVFPPSINSSQTSGELSAQYKSSLLKGGETMVDLTCGLGVDAFFFAQKASRVCCCEKQDWLCKIAESNFKALKVDNCEFVSAACEDYLAQMEPCEVIYIDPSRRDENLARVYAVEDCSPNVVELQEQLLCKAPRVIIKLSPMSDLKSLCRDLQKVSDIHVVSVENECKEVLVELKRDYIGQLTFHAVNMTKTNTDILSFNQETDETACEFVSSKEQIGRFIYEPNASLMKIGRFGRLVEKYDFKKLHPHSHLFTSDVPIEHFCGRSFEVEEIRKPNAKALKDIKKANIVVRNFPQSVKELRQQTKIKEGGEDYLFFTTLCGEEKVCLLCKRI